MKPYLYLIISLISFSLLGSSQDIDTVRPGEFAYYSVCGNNNCVLVGLLKISNTDFIMRVFDINDKSESIGLMELGKEKDARAFLPKSQNKDASMSHIVFGLNHINFWLHAQEKSLKSRSVGTRKRIVWPHYQRDHDFEYVGWAPYFGFLDAKYKDGKYAFKLAAMGRITGEKDFDTFKLFWRHGRNPIGEQLKISEGQPQVLQLGGLKLNLDTQWIENKEEGQLHLKYYTDEAKKSVPAAWIQYEKLTKSYDFNELARNVLVSFGCIMVEDSRVNAIQKKIVAARYIGNTAILKTFVLVKGGPGNYELTRISVWHDVYEKNKGYFDKLISKNLP